jgi:NhaP-type Na+/H+ or K+/H+ antiporter
MTFDAHAARLLALGVIMLLVAWLPLLLSKLPLSLPMLCLALGIASAALSHVGLAMRPITDLGFAEHLAEAALVISLMGAGLKIDRPFRVRTWTSCFRLLLLGMPLCIAIMLVLCGICAKFSWPVALLLAAALSPTDPVLASEVTVGPPGVGEEGEIRFALTAEAGFNDALASPFVALALQPLLGAHVTSTFVALHFGLELLVGTGTGVLLGKAFGWLSFRVPRLQLSTTGDGVAALGMTGVAYGAALMLHGNGFLAVFSAALTLRSHCPEHRYHGALADFADAAERVSLVALLLSFGAAVGAGLLAPLSVRDFGVAALLLLVARPLTAWISLLGSPHPRISRALTSFFGIRGVGTLYYIVYALRRVDIPEGERVLAFASLVVLGSIILHGISATPLMRRADRIRRAMDEADEPSRPQPV